VCFSQSPTEERELRPYIVAFQGNGRETGETRGFLADEFGLHLFPREDGKTRRVFMPWSALESYRIGPLLGRVLVERGSLSEEVLEAALKAKREGGGRLGEVLKGMGAVSEEEVKRALAEKLGLAFIRLRETSIDPKALDYVPAVVARRYGVIPLRVEGRKLMLAMRDPTDTEAVNMVRFISGLNVEPVVTTDEDIAQALDKHYGPLEEAILIEAIEEEGEAEQALDEEAIERQASERPIVRLVHNMLVDAVRKGASDIHLRPGEVHVDLLYRIDGTLIPVRTFSKVLLPAIVARIKVMGKMNIAERRVPQDGRVRLKDGNKVVDLRISTIPTVYGESVAIRILDAEASLKNLEEIGFSKEDEARIRDILNRSYGMFLVTGPTGSGKSTTLYAAINEVKKRNVNLITIEDPVEYRIPGVQQIQVNPTAGLTFARALRNILRHDPDVIMVGEIRDQETAKTAVESALTGHLLLSTLHTNDAPSAVTRLLEMGVEAYLVSATVLGVLAQRLVRRNCPYCM
ncbi:MAG: type II/IV secretion system protein, partial [Gammaproteobacteria bacterium]